MPDTLPESENQFITELFGTNAPADDGLTIQETNAPSLLPKSGEELARMPPSSMEEYQRVVEEQRQKTLGKEEGVPLQEGLDPWTHLMVQMRRTKEDQLKYLAGKFGAENVRLNELQEPVVRVPDPATKKTKDIVVNPHTINLNDLVTIGSYAPEVVGSILALRFGSPAAAKFLGGPTAALGKIGQALVGSVGAETAGAAKDIATRAIDRPDNMDIGEIAESRARSVPVDVALARGADVLVAKPAQLVFDVLRGKGLPNPFGSKMSATPELSEEGKAAAQRLGARYNQQPVQFSPGESTGWPALQMAEAYSTAQPAGTSTMVKAAAKQDEQIMRLQEAMLDPASLPSDEDIGRVGLNAISRSIKPTETAVEQTRGQAAKEAQERILQGLKVSDIPVKGVMKSETGDIVTRSALEKRDQFFEANEINYGKLFSHPLATAAIIDGDLVAKPINRLIGKLPKVEEISGGVPTERLLKKQIKPGLLSRLKELESMAGGKVSLQSLKQIRTDIDDAIKIGEAISGEGVLKETRNIISRAIQQGIDSTGDPTLKQLWRTANNYYKTNVERFTEKNIAALFRDASQSSSIGGSQFVDNVIASPDKYGALKQFLKPGSPELDAFNKTVSDTLLHDSLADGVSKTVDGKTLVSKLIDLRKKNPDLYATAFGSRGNDLIREANALGAAQGKLDLEEVAKFLDPRSPSSMSLWAIRSAEERKARVFNNQVVRKFLSGDKSVAEVNPDELVRYLPQTKLSDVKGVMTRIASENPQAAEQFQRKSLQALLQDASRTPTPEDVLHELQGKPGAIISGVALKKAIGTGDQMEKYKALLGPELFNDLSDYIKVELVREKKRILAAGTGILTKGQAIGEFYRALKPGGSNNATMSKEFASIAFNKAVALALSSKTLRAWLTSPHTLADMPKVTQSIIASEPFIKAAIEEFPGDLPRAYQFLSFVKQMSGLSKAPENAGKLPSEKNEPLPPTEGEFLKQFEQQ